MQTDTYAARSRSMALVARRSPSQAAPGRDRPRPQAPRLHVRGCAVADHAVPDHGPPTRFASTFTVTPADHARR